MSLPNTPLNLNVHRRHLRSVIQIPASPLLKKIGFGTGVAVYELERSPRNNKFRSPWALKKLMRRNHANPELQNRLKLEADVLRKLSHPNIVGFRAFVQNSDGNSVLAMEECTSCLGDIIDARFEENLGPYPARLIVKVCSDIADALNYLHNKALLMHCDVKSFNVLIKGDFEICKLCDFGVCLPVTKSGEVDQKQVIKSNANAEEVEYVGTSAWCPPEVFQLPPVITTKADIYSYGLLIWEMIALTPPYVQEIEDSFGKDDIDFSDIIEIDDDSFQSNDSVIEIDEESLTEIIKESVSERRPPLPEDVKLGKEYDRILEVYFICTQADRDKRPNAKDVVNIFKEITVDYK